MKRSLVIIGSGGMLGSEILYAARRRGIEPVVFAGSRELNITDDAAVHTALSDASPSVVINAAAYTDVDGAERELDQAMAVNAEGPGNLARTCASLGATLVHFSTDYVFDGSGAEPYPVTHPTSPINAYGRSKLAGEQAIVASGCRHLILRTSWLFAPHGKNFVRTIAKAAMERPQLDVVDDQRGRPTSCRDLAEMTFQLLETVDAQSRIVHACNSGECSWFDLACEIVKCLGSSCQVRPCTSAAFPRPAARPAYSVLDLAETEALIGAPRHWRTALAQCIGELNQGRMSPVSASTKESDL